MNLNKKLKNILQDKYVANEGIISDSSFENLKFKVASASELYPSILSDFAKSLIFILSPILSYNIWTSFSSGFFDYIMMIFLCFFASIVSFKVIYNLHLFRLSIVEGFEYKDTIFKIVRNLGKAILTFWALSFIILHYMFLSNKKNYNDFEGIFFQAKNTFFMEFCSFGILFASFLLFISILSMEIKRMGLSPICNQILKKLNN